MKKLHYILLLPIILFTSCDLELAGTNPDDPQIPDDEINQIDGNPSAGSNEIYSNANLNNLCPNNDESCQAPYETLPETFINTDNSDLTDTQKCNFDYNPNQSSAFVLNRVDGSVNGLELFFSKEDLFFIAWVSIRYKINPYFLMGVLSAESRGNCAAVSGSHGEGCFQITNTFGQGQLDDSYPARVAHWFWTDRSGRYYPDEVFVDEESYFGENPSSDQFRVTLDPNEFTINDVDISSVVNFHFGIIASGLYFHWQHYLLYHQYEDLHDKAEDLFAQDNGKALWQAAAYNGGAFGAARALRNVDDPEDFLDEMRAETQNYAPLVADYCHSYQEGELAYEATYTKAEVNFIIDLLRQTYPRNTGIDWDEVKSDVSQVFFEEGTTRLNFTDDIKALIYVISTHDPKLAPEWPDDGSI
jgi:hypothetical protein